MSRIESFEDIKAWQKARELANAIYQATSKAGFSKDFVLREQIRKAAISTVSNIAEGFERDGSREFKNFLSMAKASVAEVRAQLYIALDQKYLAQKEFDALSVQTKETGKMIGGFIRYLRTSDLKGKKFK